MQHDAVERGERAAEGVAGDEELRLRVVVEENGDMARDVVEGEALLLALNDVLRQPGRRRRLVDLR